MSLRKWFVLTLAGLLAALHGPAQDTVCGQDARLDAKVAELAKRVKELESGSNWARAVSGGGARLGDPIVAQPPNELGGNAPLEFSPTSTPFKDGFVFRSVDNRHQLRITGMLQADYRAYPNDGDAADLDTFLIRRARLGIEANVFDHYEFRFVPDWGNNRSVIQDAYLNVQYFDELQFQIGKFRPPVSYERLIRGRFIPTYERSLLDQLIPARDVGFMIHGQRLLDDRLDYAVGAFNGQISGDLDSNKLRDLAARVAIRPLNDAALPGVLRALQLGISGSIGKQEDPIAPNPLRTPASIPWLTFAAGVRGDGIRTRWTPELSYFHRGLGFTTQYFRMDQEMRSGGAASSIVNVPFEGYYFLLTCFVTGEERSTYNEVIKPLRPFDLRSPLRSPGAWEPVVRVSHLRVGEQIFASGAAALANPALNSPSATELTVGFNWYLNSLVRVQFNWEHAWYARPITLGTNAAFRQTDAAVVRVRTIF